MLLYVYVIVACVCVVVFFPVVVVMALVFPLLSYLLLPPFSCSRCHVISLAKHSFPSIIVGLQSQNCFCAASVACVHALET